MLCPRSLTLSKLAGSCSVWRKTVTPVLLDRLADVLVADIEHRDRPLPRYGDPLPEISYAVTGDALETARLQLALWTPFSPDAAVRYLNAVKNSKRPEAAMSQILNFPGGWRVQHLPNLRMPSCAQPKTTKMRRTSLEARSSPLFWTVARRQSFCTRPMRHERIHRNSSGGARHRYVLH